MYEKDMKIPLLLNRETQTGSHFEVSVLAKMSTVPNTVENQPLLRSNFK